jgi:TctA family transporter
MATALLVPVTFFMAPIPAIAAIVTATAMAIFSGDIPGCLLRIPGTPASAAYTDEAFAMTRKGQAELALGAGLVFSVVGGLFGTLVLIFAAPALADFAIQFSSYEYFWLVLLGLTCAVFITSNRPLKGLVTLFLGLLVACVGLGNPAGFPRFTFGSAEMTGGIGMIPLMIGMFAISEVIRFVVDTAPPAELVTDKVGNVLAGQWELAKKYPMQILRGSALGTVVGALPGAGADIAAWMSYAISKKFSKEPEKFGTGHVEGIVESGAANNSALAGAWIPALLRRARTTWLAWRIVRSMRTGNRTVSQLARALARFPEVDLAGQPLPAHARSDDTLTPSRRAACDTDSSELSRSSDAVPMEPPSIVHQWSVARAQLTTPVRGGPCAPHRGFS